MDKKALQSAVGSHAAARLLLQARNGGMLLHGLPPQSVPTDMTQAYAIQDEVAAALGPVGGWKVGAKGPAAQPSCAPLPAALIRAAPCSLEPMKFKLHGIEAEIAFSLKRDLPKRERRYSVDEVLDAIGAMHPAIKIVESRYVDSRRKDPLSVLADANSNGALVYGIGRTDLPLIEHPVQPVELFFNGTRVAGGVGGNPAGDIRRLVVWLANHAGMRGGLRAGQVVTTGSYTGLLFARAGTRVRAVFLGLGEVEFVFDS
jgi:2-keto-4-pentenoate hydratase